MLSTHVEIFESIGRLSVALALGSAIGFERQWRQKMAGLRTNALVALGSCGFVVFSAMVGEGDPTRVAAQVVTGIGFLGAGIILREGINVTGLNTAATLWCSAMVGTFAGAGFWAPSLVAAGFVVGTNLLLRPLVRLINTQTVSTSDAETHTTTNIGFLQAGSAPAAQSLHIAGSSPCGSRPYRMSESEQLERNLFHRSPRQ